MMPRWRPVPPPATTKGADPPRFGCAAFVPVGLAHGTSRGCIYGGEWDTRHVPVSGQTHPVRRGYQQPRTPSPRDALERPCTAGGGG